MCANPRLLTTKAGLSVEVACRVCWQCVANRKNDWVGRCIAEEQTSSVTTVVHLTYGGDDKVTGLQTDLGASILIYRDVKLWLMRLRRGRVDPVTGKRVSYPLRFFCVGEYGSLKGRAHWHVICFWQKGAPPFEDGKRNFDDPWWSHGFTMTETLRGDDAERAIRYVLKYLVKDQDSETSQSLVRMSKVPPLGAEYFRRRAADFVAQRLVPQDGFYAFRDVLGPGGVPRRFKLEGASLDLFLAEVVRLWRERYGEHPLDTSHSDFLLAWEDSKASRSSVEQLEVRKMGSRPTLPVPELYGAYRLWETRNLYVTDPVDGFRCLPRLFWSFDEEGYPAWDAEVRTATEAELIRKRSRRLSDPDVYRDGRAGR